MKRIIFSQTKEGKVRTIINPRLVYLDTSAWIDIFDAFTEKKEKIFTSLGKIIKSDYSVILSIINFLELIRMDGDTDDDISRYFSAEALNAINYVHLLGTKPPGEITEQEIQKLFGDYRDEVRILDSIDHFVLKKFVEGFNMRKQNNTAWFQKERKILDDLVIRDRTLNLSADVIELSGIHPYGSFRDFAKAKENIINAPIEEVKLQRNVLAQKKQKYQKKVPKENTEIVKYLRHRVQLELVQKYGLEKVSAFFTTPQIEFPGKDNIIHDFLRAYTLNAEQIKTQLPGFYWESKITYYNYYKAKQRATGKLGDFNHAVYIPYCNYFATSDGVLIKALLSENKEVCLTIDNKLYIFVI